MEMTETHKARVTKIIEDKMASGKYPVADLTLFDSIKDLDLASDTQIKNGVEYTHELYLEYLKHIRESLTKYQQREFGKTLKNMDIIDNQALEKEDSFLVALSMGVSGDRKYAINEMIKNYGNKINKEKFLKYHDLLLKGTSSYDKLGIRDCNTKFVGSWPRGQEEPNISYFPIDYKDIHQAIDKFIRYYNDHINDTTNDYDEFIKPILYHGLIAALQMFNDGNTRYGRLFQHVELWGMLNNFEESKTELPIVYGTRQYFPYREKYRGLIEDIVKQKDDEAWKKWIIFNLHRLQDSMYKSEADLNQIAMRRK